MGKSPSGMGEVAGGVLGPFLVICILSSYERGSPSKAGSSDNDSALEQRCKPLSGPALAPVLLLVSDGEPELG